MTLYLVIAQFTGRVKYTAVTTSPYDFLPQTTYTRYDEKELVHNVVYRKHPGGEYDKSALLNELDDMFEEGSITSARIVLDEAIGYIIDIYKLT